MEFNYFDLFNVVDIEVAILVVGCSFEQETAVVEGFVWVRYIVMLW